MRFGRDMDEMDDGAFLPEMVIPVDRQVLSFGG